MDSTQVSRAKLTDVENIYTKQETVYNLEVEEDNSYFANGIAVHNCDILASQNIDGEGAGIYKHSPNRHPGCYCYIYPVYRPKRGTATYPNVSGKEPDTSDLDKSQYKLAKVLT